MLGIRSLRVAAAAVLVSVSAPASAFHTPFAYRVDRFEADGNTFGPLDGTPGYVDEFADGSMSPYWYRASLTARRSPGMADGKSWHCISRATRWISRISISRNPTTACRP